MSDVSIPNVIAERYASTAMRAIWSARGKVILEREFWIAVLKAQNELGLSIPDGAIEAYEAARDTVDLESIRRREERTRHDVKARIEEFCAISGHEQIHKGMTSRDLTENVEQLQIFRALGLIRMKASAALLRMGSLAREYRDLLMTGRTHNVAAQPITFGKRVAMFGEELLASLERAEALLASYPVRGLKGAVGTQLDMLTLFGDDSERVYALEERVSEFLGLPGRCESVGQVYPRSLDFEVVSTLLALAGGPTSFARTLRLMAGHELAGEGFAEGQVGSSSMPHKMNARSCERICGFKAILAGHLTMAASLVGGQWNEGDVSCSVVRRVMLPDAFFAADGLLETFLTVLNQMVVYEEVVAAENRKYFPFLLSTTILMEAVRTGAGREKAHEAIKEHAVAVAENLRAGGQLQNDLLDRLAGDERIGLNREQLDELLRDAGRLSGLAGDQVDRFAERVEAVAGRCPEASDYRPEPIL